MRMTNFVYYFSRYFFVCFFFYFQKLPTLFVLPKPVRSSVSDFIIPSANKTCQQGSQSSIRSDEGLTLETPVLQDFHGGNPTFSNSFDVIEFSCFTLPPTQHHSFFRNQKFFCHLSVSQLEFIFHRLVTQSVDRSVGGSVKLVIFSVFYRWTKRDDLAAVARRPHAHGDSSWLVCVYTRVVLVSFIALHFFSIYTFLYHWAKFRSQGKLDLKQTKYSFKMLVYDATNLRT